MSESSVTLVFLSLVAFMAGLLNSIGGGGAILKIPAMLLFGVTPQQAVAVTKFGGMFGHATALFAFARHGYVPFKPALLAMPCSLVGAAIGSQCLMFIPPDLAGKIVAIVLPLVAFFLLFPWKNRKPAENIPSGRRFWIILPCTCFIVGIYDGAFGAAGATFLILGLHLFVRLDLVHANALSKVTSTVSCLSSTCVFLINGQILFFYAIPMAVAEMLGNVVGSHLAMLKGSRLVRVFMLISVTLMFCSLIAKYFF